MAVEQMSNAIVTPRRHRGPTSERGGGREVDIEDDPGPAIGTTGARFGGASRRKRTARRKPADPSHEQKPPEASAAEADTVAIPVVPGPVSHHAGARQHGAPAADAAPPADPAPAAD